MAGRRMLVGLVAVSVGCTHYVPGTARSLELEERLGAAYPTRGASWGGERCVQDAVVQRRETTSYVVRGQGLDYAGGGAFAAMGILVAASSSEAETAEDAAGVATLGAVFIIGGLAWAGYGLFRGMRKPQPKTVDVGGPSFATVPGASCTAEPYGAPEVPYCKGFVADPREIGSDAAAQAAKQMCLASSFGECDATRALACRAVGVVLSLDTQEVNFIGSSPEHQMLELASGHLAPIQSAFDRVWSMAIESDAEIEAVAMVAGPVRTRFEPVYQRALAEIEAAVKQESGERRRLLTEMYVRTAELMDYAFTPRGTKRDYGLRIQSTQDELAAMSRRVALIEDPAAAPSTSDAIQPAATTPE